MNSMAYYSSETFVKKLAGRKDIEEALQRLEKVTVEETRMAAAEALKAIHDVGYKVGDSALEIHDAVHDAAHFTVQAVKDGVRDVEAMIKGVDDRVKRIGEMVTIGARKMFNSSSLLLLFSPFSVKNLGRQMANDPGVIAAESLKISRKSTYRIGHQIISNKTQGIHETLEHVSDIARSVDKAQGPVNEIEVSGVDGTQAIPSNASTVSLSISYI
jgi:prophage DNA circulation protein